MTIKAETKSELESIIKSLGLTTSAKFIPFSQSRNKNEKHKSLNWLVSVMKDGKKILTTDYQQGIAHIPHWDKIQKFQKSNDGVALLEAALERGRYNPGGQVWGIYGQKPIPEPKTADILYCLTMDSNVIDFPTYEEWAHEYDMDPDSRKGDAIYRNCLEMALKLRAAIGEDGLQQLREAFQDF